MMAVVQMPRMGVLSSEIASGSSRVRLLENKNGVQVWGPPRAEADEYRPRVVCYGDSNTAGFHSGGRAFEPYGKTLANSLAAAGVPCEVAVCGLCGFTTADMLHNSDSRRVTPQCGPAGRGLLRMIEEDPVDLVIIMTGTNDLGHGTTPSTIAQQVEELHGICHDESIATVCLAPTTVSQRQMRASRQQLSDKLERWSCKARNVLDFLDVEDLLPRSEPRYWEADDLHISSLGSRTLGSSLAPHASAWLQQLEKKRTRKSLATRILNAATPSRKSFGFDKSTPSRMSSFTELAKDMAKDNAGKAKKKMQQAMTRFSRQGDSDDEE
jgi:lysophospholipase L1-like esterase